MLPRRELHFGIPTGYLKRVKWLYRNYAKDHRFPIPLRSRRDPWCNNISSSRVLDLGKIQWFLPAEASHPHLQGFQGISPLGRTVGLSAPPQDSHPKISLDLGKKIDGSYQPKPAAPIYNTVRAFHLWNQQLTSKISQFGWQKLV